MLDARVYDHMTTAMHENEYTPPPTPPSPAGEVADIAGKRRYEEIAG